MHWNSSVFSRCSPQESWPYLAWSHRPSLRPNTDGILVDILLPIDQSALDGKLAFCKSIVSDSDKSGVLPTLASIINTPPLLRAAMDELVSSQLIKRQSRELWVHRVVQEAMNYHSNEDLQESFFAAIAIVYEAFPKQRSGGTLTGQWNKCEAYISHVSHLSHQFTNYNKDTVVRQLLMLKG